MPIDPDVVLWSASERDRVDRPLLVLLHGYGSHEGDLFQLAPYLPLDAVIAAPRAPFPHPMGIGWSWFDLGNLATGGLASGNLSADPVNCFCCAAAAGRTPPTNDSVCQNSPSTRTRFLPSAVANVKS